jgi:hypothetical protein
MYSFTVTIARPVDEVFDAMADARNEIHWNDQVSASSLVGSEPIGGGSEFRTVNRGRPYRARISRYERPASLGFDVTGDTMDIRAEFRFLAEGPAAASLTASFDMRPKGVMRVLLPLMSPLLRRDFPKQGEAFKRFCESR